MKGEELCQLIKNALKQDTPAKEVMVRVIVGSNVVELDIEAVHLSYPEGDRAKSPYLILTT
jgi:hypothetical protein